MENEKIKLTRLKKMDGLVRVLRAHMSSKGFAENRDIPKIYKPMWSIHRQEFLDRFGLREVTVTPSVAAKYKIKPSKRTIIVQAREDE